MIDSLIKYEAVALLSIGIGVLVFLAVVTIIEVYASFINNRKG